MRVVFISHVAANPANRGRLRALAGSGCSVAVAVPDRWVDQSGGAQEHAWADDAGVRVVPIPVRGGERDVEQLRWSRRALRRLLSDVRPDLVQIEEEPWTQAAATTARIAARLGIPTVIFAMDSVPRSYPPLQRMRRARTLKAAVGLIGLNSHALSLLARSRPDLPQAVIPQLGVVPPPALAPSSRGGLAIGFIGRLVPEKGLDLLLRACARLTGNWTITVVGAGPAQEELEALAERLGIAARIEWLGAPPRGELERVWPRLDCLVSPARTTQRWVESAGRAVLDAMAHGVPVIVSASGVLPEAIGPAGIVVPEDDVPALAAALQLLDEAPAERARLGQEGRRRALAEYTDDALAAKTVRFWRSVLVPGPANS